MAIAFLSAERSKDQVGACLVSQDGVILGIGYNGFPRGCSDDKLPWAQKSRTGNPLKTKYPCNLVDGFFFLLVYFCYVCHAEVNAILNTNHASAAGQRLYVTMFPCNECAKIIIQLIIIFKTGLIYKFGRSFGALPVYIVGIFILLFFLAVRNIAYVASHKLLSLAGVKFRKHQPMMNEIHLKFEEH
ncbi:hypothetical protein GYH30_047140 [Glycine max]|uniref:dCMP deaminase n=1 Tax=Glycine soja TaxID=3848 RepID=A0A445G686_GLYSO|nr:hypothetical protein GYH30_047140 [Glycine max]RZB56676.1 Deoxycytidylate deaminase [Glycine soja]